MREENNRGFTLIELIVSLAITVVIAAFVFSFASSLAGVWKGSEGQIDAELDANIALDILARDLESAVFREGEGVMFAVSAIAHSNADIGAGEVDITLSNNWENTAGGSAGAKPDSLHFVPATHHYGWAGVWLRFFSAQPSVNAVSYQIVRRFGFSNSNTPRYLLHRSVVRLDKTLEAGLDISSPSYAGIPDSYVDAENVTRPWLTNAVLENVVDFGVRLYVFDEGAPATDYSPEGLRLIFPSSDVTPLDANDRSHFATTASINDPSIAYPEVLEIYLRVLSSVGAERLRELEENDVGESYAEIVEQYGRIYRRMVRLPGAKG